MSTLEEQNIEIGHATDVDRLDHIPTILRNLPNKMPRTVTYRKRKSLPEGYKPGEFDVCCGRGKRHWNHIGNVRFRRIIQSNVERYMDAPSKNDKTAVVVSIVTDIRHMNGCFLKEDLRGNWYDIGDQQAREKVGHSLRDQVSTINRQRRGRQAMLQQHEAALQQHRETQQKQASTATAATAVPLAAFSSTMPSSASMSTTPSQSSMPMSFPTAMAPGQLPAGGGPAIIDNLSLSTAADSTNTAAAAATTNHNNSNTSSSANSRSPMTFSLSGPASHTSASFKDSDFNEAVMKVATNNSFDNTNNNAFNDPLLAADVYGGGYVEEEDEGALSDGGNEREARRSTLMSSSIIDKFARRPSFASAVADPISNSFSSSGRSASAGQFSGRVGSVVVHQNSSNRSSGWSFLQELDFNMEQFDQDFQDGLDPLQVKGGAASASPASPSAAPKMEPV